MPGTARRWPGRYRQRRVYFVPAFSGLFAPYWRPTPAGRSSVVRFKTRPPIWPGRRWSDLLPVQGRGHRDGARLRRQARRAQVDGGVTANTLCMQLQSNILGVPVSKPVVAETTALGAAYAAGLATGFWRDSTSWRQLAGGQPLVPDLSQQWRDAATPAGRRPSSDPQLGGRRLRPPVLETVRPAGGSGMRSGPAEPRRRVRALARMASRRSTSYHRRGVTGAGAALDAVTRGLSVALVEARDYSSGT